MSEEKVVQVAYGILMGYRRGSNTQYPRQVLVRVIESLKRRVDNLIGMKAVVRDKYGNEYIGRVVRTHARGKNNVIIVVFNRNLPGQVIGSEVKIYY